MKVEILKPTMYKLRQIENSGCSYALITLTDLHENAGTISIESDYGNWSYMWGSMGGNIRRFILRTSEDYLMDKFTYNNHKDRDCFRFDKTIKRIKKEIIQARKEMEIERVEAREMYNEVDDLDSNAPDNKDAFYMYADSHCPKLFEFYDWESFPIETEYGHSLQSFMKEVLPVFKDIIRKELSNDKNQNQVLRNT